MSPKMHLILVQGILIVGSVYFLVGLAVDAIFYRELAPGGWLRHIIGAVIFGAIMGWWTWKMSTKPKPG